MIERRTDRPYSDDPYSDLPCDSCQDQRSDPGARESVTPMCAEAQADGVPCYELGRDCETCEKAYSSWLDASSSEQ